MNSEEDDLGFCSFAFNIYEPRKNSVVGWYKSGGYELGKIYFSEGYKSRNGVAFENIW